MRHITLEDMTTEEMNLQRIQYQDSISRIKRKWNTMGFESRYRAGHTLLNIRGQLARIDELQASYMRG